MKSFALAVCIGLLFLVSPAARAADPVAFVSDFRGEVTVDVAGRPAFLAELLPGTRLVLGRDASASVMYVVTGEEFALRGPGEFVVTRQGVKAEKGNAPASRIPAVKASMAILVQTSRAATASLRMRSAPAPRSERAGPAYPADAKIATLQPTLRCAGEAGASRSVVVATVAGSEVYRGSVKGNSIRLPVRLAAGQAYAWTCAIGTGEPAEARFETLPAEAIATAEKARAAARTFPDRVLFAMLLQEIGAAQDAREAWAQLARERPDIPELAGLAR